MLNLRLSATLFALVAFAGAAQSATFTFSGVCSDCTGNGTATLVVNNAYVPGTALATSDLVSFNYHGTDLLPAFVLSASDSFLLMSGNLPATSGPALFHLEGGALVVPAGFSGATGNPLARFTFDTDTQGNWSAFDAALNFCSLEAACDFGSNGTWNGSAVPEPSAVLLVAGGLAALGLRRWKLKA